jgi:hypothetical protein
MQIWVLSLTQRRLLEGINCLCLEGTSNQPEDTGCTLFDAKRQIYTVKTQKTPCK